MTDPSASGEEIDWLLSGPWATLAFLVIAAVAVLLVGNLLARARRGGRARASFDLEVARMESLPVTPSDQVAAGPAHVEGVVASSTGSLGGPLGRPRIYQNRAGSDRKTAVGTELFLVRDARGQVAIENIEEGRVLAPVESGGPHDVVALYIGDRVQVLGVFETDVRGDPETPHLRVYGSFGSKGQVQVKVLERPKPPADADNESTGDDPPGDKP